MSEFGMWIPVTERLPEDGGGYLIQYKNKNGNQCQCIEYFNPMNRTWQNNPDIGEIIAWMNLPDWYDPPKRIELSPWLEGLCERGLWSVKSMNKSPLTLNEKFPWVELVLESRHTDTNYHAGFIITLCIPEEIAFEFGRRINNE